MLNYIWMKYPDRESPRTKKTMMKNTKRSCKRFQTLKPCLQLKITTINYRRGFNDHVALTLAQHARTSQHMKPRAVSLLRPSSQPETSHHLVEASFEWACLSSRSPYTEAISNDLRFHFRTCSKIVKRWTNIGYSCKQFRTYTVSV